MLSVVFLKTKKFKKSVIKRAMYFEKWKKGKLNIISHEPEDKPDPRGNKPKEE